MRFSAFLCAAADFVVRFSYNAMSLFSASYDMIFLQIKPAPHCGTSSLQVSSLLSVCYKKIFFQTRGSAAPASRASRLFLFFARRSLEVKLQRELHQTRMARPLNAAEVCSVCGISIRLKELRVIECIKEFGTKINSIPFADWGALYESEFPIVDSWTAADRPRGIANRSWRNCGLRERVRVESSVDQCARRRISAGACGTCQLTRIDGMERSANIGLSRRFKIKAGLQFDVVLLRNTNRKPALERSDPRHRPAIQGFAFKSLILGNWKFPVVTEYEPVPGIEQRKRPIPFRIDRVDEVFKRGCIVQRLANGVRRGKLQSVRESLLQACLKRVIRRIGNRILRKNAGEDVDSIWRATCSRKRVA